MRLIDADKLEANMCHEAFETDTDMQKWDSGCWIRYKMFENQIEKLPTVKAIPIDWLRMWFTKKASLIGITLMSEIETEWEKENEQNDN